MLRRRRPRFVPPKLALTREGSTDLYVPAESLRAKEPKTFPAFFNPAARVNRDVSVAVAKATRPATFLDALAGVGARGVRDRERGVQERRGDARRVQRDAPWR